MVKVAMKCRRNDPFFFIQEYNYKLLNSIVDMMFAFLLVSFDHETPCFVFAVLVEWRSTTR